VILNGWGKEEARESGEGEEVSMVEGLLIAEIGEIKGTKHGSALTEVLNKLRAPEAQPFIRLTLEEAGALKLYLQETIRSLRFEEDKIIQERLKEIERFLIKLNSSSPKPIQVPEFMIIPSLRK